MSLPKARAGLPASVPGLVRWLGLRMLTASALNSQAARVA